VEPNWQLVRKKDTIIARARILQQIRAFFVHQDFIEVETPQRIPVNAPEFAIDAIPSADWFLQTSPELCMKRLLAAGYDRLFQICHCWRAGERSDRHLPEYTMLEWYHCQRDYRQLMTDCENLLLHLLPQQRLNWQGRQIDLTPPWPRLTVAEAFAQHGSIPLSEITDLDFFSELMITEIEPALPQNQPLFLIDYPLAHGSLARRKAQDSTIAERFELYLGGLELANGFSELTDAQEQRQRFAAEEALRRSAGKPPCPTPNTFLNELETLGDAAGIALGVDRLVMLLCDRARIDEVVCFTPEQL
jgi:lysyl-tRNA synthetase class 2